MGRQTQFVVVPTGNSEFDRFQHRLAEALRVTRQSPQALLTARGSIVAASGDGQPVEHKVSATDGLPLLTDSTKTNGLNYSALSLASAVTGVLPIANGGTNSSTALTNGKLMIASGSAIVEGPAGTATTVLHGNAAGNPTYSGVDLASDTTANQGTATTVLHGNAAGQPSFATIVNADITSVDASKITTGTLPIARGGTNSATAMSGNSIIISNGSAIVQGAAGTTTTLLHGNAAGSPTYSAVSLTADVSGVLPEANGGTNQSTYTQGDVLYASAANTLAKLAKGSTGAILQQTATIPQWYTTPVLCATTTAGQTINASTLTVVVYGTEEIDSDAAYNSGTGVFTVPTGKGGDYIVSAAITYSAAITATDVEIDIYVNGTQKRSVQAVNPAANQTLTVAAVMHLAAADTVEIKTFQNSAASKTLNATGTENYLNIKQVA